MGLKRKNKLREDVVRLALTSEPMRSFAQITLSLI